MNPITDGQMIPKALQDEVFGQCDMGSCESNPRAYGCGECDANICRFCAERDCLRVSLENGDFVYFCLSTCSSEAMQFAGATGSRVQPGRDVSDDIMAEYGLMPCRVCGLRQIEGRP